MPIDLKDYIPVSERIDTFKTAYPEGRLQSEIVDTGHPGYIAVKAYAYRTPDDPLPGIGLAWERVPGPTPFTKDSELQNAETAAWGRALVAALIADTSRGIASADEVAAAEDRRNAPQRTDPDISGKDWLATAIQVFGLWTPEQRKAAGTAAMKELGFKNPLSLDQAKAVKRKMDETYAVEYPTAASELPF